MKNIFTIWIPILIFHLLFWEAEQGLNLLLFTWVLTGAVFVSKTYLVERKEVLYLLGAWNAVALFFVWHDSMLSLVVYWLLFFVTIGFLQEIRVRFWFFGFIESVRALFAGWAISSRNASNISTKSIPIWSLLKRARLVLIPIIIIIPFYMIYTQASSDFGIINDKIGAWFNSIFSIELEWGRFFHFVLGIVLVLAVIGKRVGIVSLHKISDHWTFDLIRQRKESYVSHKTMALKREYQIALMSFISLNALLLFVNILDLVNVWFSFEERTATELSQYVHQGTYLLIFSIIMAMVVVLGFLRGNLNFYKNNKTLISLTTIWLVQNAFLAISVAIRNGHYIHHYGLAHGRIQVMFFLLAVLFGLFLMYKKVQGPKTIFYLIQTNGWAIVTLLVVACSVNWDATITRYNLKHQFYDNPYHLYSLNNNLLPLIDDLNEEFGHEPSIELKNIINKGESHIRRWENSDWRSWTWSGHRQYWAFKELYE